MLENATLTERKTERGHGNYFGKEQNNKHLEDFFIVLYPRSLTFGD